MCGRFTRNYTWAQISTATIARDDGDLEVVSEQCLRRCRLAMRQQSHDPPRLQITNDAAVPQVSAPSPVIDADDLERIGWQTSAAPTVCCLDRIGHMVTLIRLIL